MSLVEWGWDARRGQAAAALLSGGARVARVVGQGRDLYGLADGESLHFAPVCGSFRYRAVLASDYPVTGDFVACREEHGTWVIEQVLTRTGVLSRKAAGRQEEQQVLAANVDVALLVFAAETQRGFVPGLVERLLTLAHEGGVEPVIVLNKADLAPSLEPYREQARAFARGVPLLCTSALDGRGPDARGGLDELRGLRELRALLAPGKTFALLGKSGVGKSSLLNALLGRPAVRTSEIREADGRGRHTTTSRDLFRLPGGALLMDSPGLREAALWADEASVEETFPEVAALADSCRFRDCSHSGEPGCAVQDALEQGALDPQRYERYLAQLRESRYHRRLADGNAQRAERLRWKKIAKLQKDLKQERKHSP